jgi:uncharacterized protein (TIGR03083 family)
MTNVLQFYGEHSVPLQIPTSPEDVTAAWSAHRSRMRRWLGGLPADAWAAPTRCTEWNVLQLVQHLVSGAQFLGYTLHQSAKGIPTRLLAGFNSQSTAATRAQDFAGSSPSELLTALAEMDRRVEQELTEWGADGAESLAEIPAGTAPAYVAVNHFLFDSWVHERDVLIPAGELPTVERREILAVASYVVGLAGVARAAEDARQEPLHWAVRLTDLGVTLDADTTELGTTVSFAPDEPSLPTVRGPAAELVDFATGRASAAPPDGDPAALRFLIRFARVLG